MRLFGIVVYPNINKSPVLVFGVWCHGVAQNYEEKNNIDRMFISNNHLVFVYLDVRRVRLKINSSDYSRPSSVCAWNDMKSIKIKVKLLCKNDDGGGHGSSSCSTGRQQYVARIKTSKRTARKSLSARKYTFQNRFSNIYITSIEYHFYRLAQCFLFWYFFFALVLHIACVQLCLLSWASWSVFFMLRSACTLLVRFFIWNSWC